MESSFLIRDQALSFWSGSTDSKVLDYQRTNPREYQIVRTHTKETWQNPTTSSSLCGTPHLNNKQTKKYKPNHQQTGLAPHSAWPSEEKQASKQTKKNSAQISPYRKLTQTTRPTLGRKKQKGKKNSSLKPGEKKKNPKTQ